MPPVTLAYRPDIDGLRAVAVLAVLAYHAFPQALPGGFAGVDIFFVISGYLISSILLAQIDQRAFSLAGFYARRVRRIFPALLLVLASCLGIGWAVLLPDEFRSLGQHTAAAAVFGSNAWLWHEIGYFDTAAGLKPLLHLWSLAIEEQFYVVWPLLLWLCCRWRGMTRDLVLLATVLSFAACLASLGDPPAMFYFPWNRAWELLLGALLALQRGQAPTPLRPALANALAFGGAGLVVAALALLDSRQAFPGWRAVLPTAGAVLLIAAGRQAWPNRWLLSLRPVVFIGLVSYPLYLWHWPLLVFARIVEGQEPSVAVRATALAASAVLACLTWLLLERPLRRGGRAVVAGLVAGMVVLGGTGYLAGKAWLQPRASLSGLDAIMKATSDWDHGGTHFLFNDRHFAQAGQQTGPATLFIGDSHMEQYLPRISQLLSDAPGNYQRAIYATNGGCPPVRNLGTLHSPKDTHCRQFMATTMQLAAATPDITTVVIAAMWHTYFISAGIFYYDDQGTAYPISHPASEGARRAFADLERLVGDFRREGKRVYLLRNTPFGRELSPRELVARSWSTLATGFHLTHARGGIDRRAFDAQMAPVNRMLDAIAVRTGAVILDPADWLCTAQACPPLTADGAPIYMDQEHLNARFVREHLTVLDQLIAR